VKIWKYFDESFRRDDRSGQSAFHVAGTPPIDFAVDMAPAKGVLRPSFADLDHVCVRVEMNAVACVLSIPSGNYVPARIGLTIAGGAVGADQLNIKTRRRVDGLLKTHKYRGSFHQVGLALGCG
jgi:hypothetical protein